MTLAIYFSGRVRVCVTPVPRLTVSKWLVDSLFRLKPLFADVV